MTDFLASPVTADPTTSAATGRRPTSAARIAANQRNAQLSTGPRTEEGKARSRQNAVKHGLAGDGICLPSEDAALVRERCLQLHEEMAPKTVLGMMLVETIALAHTRMKRAARQEVAVLSYKQRHAAAAFDDARLAQAEDDLYRIGLNNVTQYRHLIATPEGIDLLILRLGDVRREVRNPRIRWNYVHGSCFENFCGRDYHDHFTTSRGRALSLALEFDPSELTDADKAEIGSEDVKQVREWAKPQMEAFIDAEIARLQAHRATLDHDAIARDRAEAAERAMFDAGRDASLARRYEAAASRTLFRAIKEYPNIEGQGGEPDPEAPSALHPPSIAAAETLDEGDAIVIVDPADRAALPPPPRRVYTRPPLGSSGISAEEASRVLSQPHYSRSPVPFDQPLPPVDTTPYRCR